MIRVLTTLVARWPQIEKLINKWIRTHGTAVKRESKRRGDVVL
jgi:hypothetical protein